MRTLSVFVCSVPVALLSCARPAVGARCTVAGGSCNRPAARVDLTAARGSTPNTPLHTNTTGTRHTRDAHGRGTSRRIERAPRDATRPPRRTTRESASTPSARARLTAPRAQRCLAPRARRPSISPRPLASLRRVTATSRWCRSMRPLLWPLRRATRDAAARRRHRTSDRSDRDDTHGASRERRRHARARERHTACTRAGARAQARS